MLQGSSSPPQPPSRLLRWIVFLWCRRCQASLQEQVEVGASWGPALHRSLSSTGCGLDLGIEGFSQLGERRFSTGWMIPLYSSLLHLFCLLKILVCHLCWCSICMLGWNRVLGETHKPVLCGRHKRPGYSSHCRRKSCMPAILMEVISLPGLSPNSVPTVPYSLCTSTGGYSYFIWDSQQGMIYFILSCQYCFLSNTHMHTSATSVTKLVMKHATWNEYSWQWGYKINK